MITKNATVGSTVGLHARPAAVIAEAAEALGSDVTVNGVDAASSLMLMTLGAQHGDVLEIAGSDEAAVAKIVELVEFNHDA
ncbi:HPr family phosphocarrier protein [Nocardioides yefusunii]|uniref:Phosphocarrier protein HPr n=1 Tax=Nocardioides yefusunii TaxID=2500546 RepID=A0ABW1QV47_9ACTN|nr:HPr family phosphocarrier protein [Nocardioides yefusunii]